ncbi:MAG: hypothetical protein F6J93_33320 [Oscillatoria sp. SIO1A7]|nr:hypothetical protein [Oscillatoria sp. SIO1A7]
MPHAQFPNYKDLVQNEKTASKQLFCILYSELFGDRSILYSNCNARFGSSR